MMPAPSTVTLYGKEECCLCNQAMEILLKVRESVPFDLEKIDISADPELLLRFEREIPVIFVDGRKMFRYRVKEDRFRRAVTKG
ncbi:MAG: glutaredoxin family protein [Chlorobiaceae bacterium]